MGEGESDQDYDNCDKLPEEILNAPCTREAIQSGASPSFEPISTDEVRKPSASTDFCDLLNASQAVKVGDSIFVDDNLAIFKAPFHREVNSSNYHGASSMTIDQETSNLASAFEGISFKDRIISNSTNPSFESNPASTSHALNGCNSARFNRFSSGLDTADMSVPASPTMLNGVYLPNLAPEGCFPFITMDEPNIHSRIVDGHYNARVLVHNFYDQRNQIPKSILGDHTMQWQSNPGCAAMPVNAGMTTFLPPGGSSQGFEFPTSSFQRHYMDGPSLTYIPYCCQSQFSIEGCENERNYRSHPWYLYLQQLQNQRLEGHLQERRNSATVPLCESALCPYLHMPTPHQAGEANPASYQYDNVTYRRNFQLDPLPNSDLSGYYHGYSGLSKNSLFLQGQKLSSFCDFCGCSISSQGNQVSDRFGFPENFLTICQGVNTLQTLTFGSVGRNQSLEHADNTRRGFPSDNVHNCLIQGDNYSNLGIQRSWSPYPENSDTKHDLKSLHLEYDSLNNIIGQVHILAKDSEGCCFFQRILNKGNRGDVDKIFVQIIGHIFELITSRFGNRLVHKLVEVCTEEQLTRLICEFKQSAIGLLGVSCNPHGAHVVQKLIETVKSHEQYSLIVFSLKPDIVSLIKNNNGSHVAEHCLQYLPHNYRELLFEAAVANSVDLARHHRGCCMLQKCISTLDGELQFQLISKLISKACDLSQDPFGNYVVQHILRQEIPWATNKLLDQLDGYYRTLSMQKYSSNVVEKCLEFTGDDRRADIIKELIDDPCLVQILQDPFGNYVIQAARRVCKGPLLVALLDAIRPHAPELRLSPFGKRVLPKRLQ